MIRFLTSGLYTSIQDQGRFGFRKFGVPTAGCMDQKSALLANYLVGNTSHTPIIEFLRQGPVIEFQTDAIISITGGLFTPSINQKPLLQNTRELVRQGQVLRLGTCTLGMYGYLAIQGGMMTEKVMGSYSYSKGITKKSMITKHDEFPLLNSTQWKDESHSKVKITPFRRHSTFDVIRGPEFHQLDEEAIQKLAEPFELTQDLNRMGSRIKKKTNLFTSEILTAPVTPGMIQLTPSGQLIALLRDAQTTGGYARILQLTPDAVNEFVHLKPRDHFYFNLID